MSVFGILMVIVQSRYSHDPRYFANLGKSQAVLLIPISGFAFHQERSNRTR
jgi:hypothetical protein